MLRPQDILLACKLHALDKTEWTFAWMSKELGISIGEIYNAQKRLREALVLVQIRGREVVAGRRLYELLAYAVPCLYYAERGKVAMGVLTGIQAVEDSGGVDEQGIDNSLVWQWHEGEVRGESIEPIYPSLPGVALRDPQIHELFALMDVVRVGEPSMKRWAREKLERKLVRKED